MLSHRNAIVSATNPLAMSGETGAKTPNGANTKLPPIEQFPRFLRRAGMFFTIQLVRVMIHASNNISELSISINYKHLIVGDFATAIAFKFNSFHHGLILSSQ